MPWLTSCHQLNMTCGFSWFNKNNSSTAKDIKNLSTKLNWSDSPTDKVLATPLEDERKHSFLVSSYSIVKYDTLVLHILITSIAILETLIFELVMKRAFRKCILLPLSLYGAIK